MSDCGRKHSMSNGPNTGHVGAPPKRNTAQCSNPEESLQGTNREV